MFYEISIDVGGNLSRTNLPA